MNRTDLLERIAHRMGADSRLVKAVLDTALEEIATAVVAGERVTLTGLGTFSREWRPPRKGRHPRTGRLVSLHPRYSVRFRASVPLRRELERLVPHYDSDGEHVRARRAARTAAEDLKLYHPELIKAASRGKSSPEFQALVEDARTRYRERVPPHVHAQRDYFAEELSALLSPRSRRQGPLSS